jgi:hypothetical protein
MLSCVDDGAFTEIGLVDGVDETRNTEWRLRDGDVEGDRPNRSVVGDTEPQTAIRVLQDSAERQSGARSRSPCLPARAVGQLQLNKSCGRPASAGREGNADRTTIGVDLNKKTVVAAGSRVVADTHKLLGKSSNA